MNLLNKTKLPSDQKLIWNKGDEKLTQDEIAEFVETYLASDAFAKLTMYGKYYEGVNPDITGKYISRKWRGKTPNNYIPTAYYSTVVDTMAGYMFSNVQYEPVEPGDVLFVEALNELNEANDEDIKTMKTGVESLAYNKGIQLVYTTGDGVSAPDIRFASLDPRTMILIWTDDIEPEIFCGIRVTASNNPDYDYNIDVIYKDEWQFYWMGNGKLAVREESKELFFSECPVVLYSTEIMTNNSPFQVIIPYIDALDYLVTGNSNEVERLVDAILVLGTTVDEERLQHMDEWKVLMDMQKEDRAEYLTKDTSPEFREYVSKLLINEIHKHAHVIDWYSPDSGLGGEISAKALRTRLFDMDMYSRRLEKQYKEGDEKKIRLINELFAATNQPTGNVEIVYKRTIPDDFEEKAPILNMLTFLSDETKLRMLNIEPEAELERLEEQKLKNVELFDLTTRDEGAEEDQEDDNE